MTILSQNQTRILGMLSKEKSVYDHFYLTGGTALAEFYLEHRLSEDLDFFTEDMFEPQDISIILKKLQKKIDIRHIRSEQSFNRNLFFLELENDVIKTEFTYFPFPRIEKKKKIDDLFIDSLIDIAVNKVFTIYQKPRSRDFIDLYFILKKENWNIDDLVKNAQIKFDHYVDPIQLGSQFLKAKELKDYPKMITQIDDTIWQDFFVNEAKSLEKQILE